MTDFSYQIIIMSVNYSGNFIQKRFKSLRKSKTGNVCRIFQFPSIAFSLEQKAISCPGTINSFLGTLQLLVRLNRVFPFDRIMSKSLLKIVAYQSVAPPFIAGSPKTSKYKRHCNKLTLAPNKITVKT